MGNKTYICPNCGKKCHPMELVTNQQIVKMGIAERVVADEVLRQHLEGYGGVIDGPNLRQIVYEEGMIPEELRGRISGRTISLQVGVEEINQKACSVCHSNITPIVSDDIEEVYNVLLVGPPSSGKTSLIASAQKYVTERPLSKKREKIFNVMSPRSWEHEFYARMTAGFPNIPPATYHETDKFNRQPLFYLRIGKKLLIFHDYPGEALNQSTFAIPHNAVPVYLCDLNDDQDKQLAFMNTKIMELHDGGRKYKNEVIALVKCDKLDESFVRSIMIKPYEQTGFKSFAGILAARRRAFSDSSIGDTLKIYARLKNVCDNIDVVCTAAYGCDTVTKNNKYRLSGEWAPQYLYDTLLTIGG